jgi:hypothetical protein
MSQRSRRILAVGALCGTGLVLVAAAHAASPHWMDWYALVAGGGTGSSSAYRLSGSVGQTAVEISDSGRFQMHAGFWPGAVVTERLPTPGPPSRTPTATGTARTSTPTLTRTATSSPTVTLTSTRGPTATATRTRLPIRTLTATPTVLARTATATPTKPGRTPTATPTGTPEWRLNLPHLSRHYRIP